MATLLQSLPVKQQNLGLYDAQHLGIYAGMTIETVGQPDDDMHKAWMPNDSFGRLPSDVVMAFHRLCIHYLGEDDRNPALLTGAKTLPKSAHSLEVGCSLYRNYATGEIRGFVEPQVVSLAHIDSRSADETRPPIDLVSGEEMPNWQDEWHEYGRLHSHNTMQASPSGTDNSSELLTPGIYGIFGNYRVNAEGGYTFSIYASVITPYPGEEKNIRRTHVIDTDDEGTTTIRGMEWADTMDFDVENDATFHEDVLKNVMRETPTEWKPTVVESTTLGTYGAAWEKWEARSKTRRSSSNASNTYMRFNEDIKEAMETAGVPKCDIDGVEWRLRTMCNALDDAMSIATDSFALVRAMSLMFETFGIEINDNVADTCDLGSYDYGEDYDTPSAMLAFEDYMDQKEGENEWPSD
jgi:hypothetical protein